jgi:hypothetical protein
VVDQPLPSSLGSRLGYIAAALPALSLPVAFAQGADAAATGVITTAAGYTMGTTALSFLQTAGPLAFFSLQLAG